MSAWQPPQAPHPPPAPRRSVAPTVLTGVACFIVGCLVGAVATSAGSDTTGVAAAPVTAAPDLPATEPPATEPPPPPAEPPPSPEPPPPEEPPLPPGSFRTGRYQFSDLQVSEQDFTGSFEMRTRVTNTGDAVRGVIWTASLFIEDRVVATLNALVNDFAAGESRTVEWFSSDNFVEGRYRVEIQIDTER